MRAAPPVQVRVDPRAARACLSALAALAAAGCAAWAWGHASWPAGWAAAALTGAGIGTLSWRGLRLDGGVLAWDGALWHWRGTTGHVHVMVDADAWMLLAFTPAEGGRLRWLPVGARRGAAAWHGLRAAVYSRGSTPPR